MSENIARDNHYIPQFYLKNWSEDGKHTWVYNTLVSSRSVPMWTESSIKSTAVWRDFYTYGIDDNETDEIEKWLDRNFEAPAKPAIDKAVAGEKLSCSDYDALINFVACQCVRTPAKLIKLIQNAKSEIQPIVDNTLGELSAAVESGGLPKKRKGSNVPYQDMLPIKADYNRDTGMVGVGVEIGKSAYLFTIRYALTKTIKVLKQHRWQILHTSEKYKLPTSDDPVICAIEQPDKSYKLCGGWGTKGGVIFMPLSPEVLIYTKIGSKRKATELDFSDFASSRFKNAIILHAFRSIYSFKPDDGIPKLRRRFVNSEQYKEEKRQQNSWHRLSSDSERKFRSGL